ncbi:MAG TPA: type II CRISPR RNA-guided endonuclease Cas9 [Acetobacteraceae bacterium]|nr:type II CRISPR RNA-guided endonuclease Cas9 [Acetobacteraceae bacterium]
MRIFGIDGGIASIGWAVLDLEGEELTVVGTGVRMFDAPETDRERTPTNAIRRLHRGQRRVLRRRRQRMAEIRQLFRQDGLLATGERDALKQPGRDPWRLRAEGLERTLSGLELAVALGHIARHRGFRSNAKRDHSSNAANDTSKMKKAIEATRERLGQWQTVGQMFACDPAYSEQKHNRGQDYSRSILRRDHEDEVRALFSAQRRFGNPLATEALQEVYADKAFSQRPLADSEHMVQRCPFETGEIRTARRSYAFEMFRLLSRAANLRLVSGGQEWKLSADQIERIASDFGRQKNITFRGVRKLLDLDPRTRFAGVSEKDETRDIVARSGGAAEGTKALRDAVGDAGWRALMHHPLQRDRIAEVLTFRENPTSIREGLEAAEIETPILDAIMDGVANGTFAAFNGAGHISAKAARTLLPPLKRGLMYSEACAEVGYDHAARPEVNLEDIRNPVARKALTEMLKQVRALVIEYGRPEFIHIELAREIGKSVEERDKIAKGIEDRNKVRDRLRAELADILPNHRPTTEDLLRYELWKEQGGRCLYSDDPIEPTWIAADDNRVQVDHILPWSRFGDDSFANKTLCTARANQAKRGRTPFEWFSEDKSEPDWAAFAARVEGCKELKARKKTGFYLRRNAKEVEERFRNRNLGDTRYATRLLLDLLARQYPADGRRHVLARPGPLTAKLRRAWGVEDMKKGPDGKRLDDDRHHALDAIVVAATTEAMLQALTRAAQEAERRGGPRGFDFAHIPCPAGFRETARAVVGDVFVSRPERRRVRGEAHAATIKQVRQVNGSTVVFERKAVEKLTLADLETIPVPSPYGNVGDPAKLRDELVASVRQWIEAGRPKDNLPRSPKGDLIRKVRVATKDKLAVPIRGGTADRGEMARVDVFAKANRRGRNEYFLVPIYPHQVADRRGYPRPPDRAVVASKPESEWTLIDASHQFRFCLYQNSLVEVTTSDGEVVRGYFKGLDRSTGAISLAASNTPTKLRRGIGARTLRGFQKLSVDRVGRISVVGSEGRTWHGEACT